MHQRAVYQGLRSESRTAGVVAILLVQEVERLWLRLSTAAVPDRGTKGFGRIAAALVAEDELERLGPLHPVIETI